MPAPANRLQQVIEAKGRVDQRSTRADFDAAGNAAKVRDPLNHANVVDQYHPFNLPRRQTEASGSHVPAGTRAAHDLVGNVLTAFDALGRRTGSPLGPPGRGRR